MNFIVGSLLYHCREDIAFWIFVTILENYEYRDVFERNLPGLYKHCHVIKRLFQLHHPKLFEHFDDHGILVEMYASDWIFCLFASLIPIGSLYSDFLDNFLDKGWPYFYSICMALLDYFKDRLMKEAEIGEILYFIKFKSPEKNGGKNGKKTRSRSNKGVYIVDEETGEIKE